MKNFAVFIRLFVLLALFFGLIYSNKQLSEIKGRLEKVEMKLGGAEKINCKEKDTWLINPLK